MVIDFILVPEKKLGDLCSLALIGVHLQRFRCSFEAEVHRNVSIWNVLRYLSQIGIYLDCETRFT